MSLGSHLGGTWQGYGKWDCYRSVRTILGMLACMAVLPQPLHFPCRRIQAAPAPRCDSGFGFVTCCLCVIDVICWQPGFFLLRVLVPLCVPPWACMRSMHFDSENSCKQRPLVCTSALALLVLPAEDIKGGADRPSLLFLLTSARFVLEPPASSALLRFL